MANIRVNFRKAPLDGQVVTFKAPCDASDIHGLVIYYPNENSEIVSTEFTLNDANGGDIGVVDNIFSAGAIVKVILDIDTNNAYVQNPDTNTYIEGKFGELQEYIDTVVDNTISSHNTSTDAHSNMGWLTSEDVIASQPTPVNANTLSGYDVSYFLTNETQLNAMLEEVLI